MSDWKDLPPELRITPREFDRFVEKLLQNTPESWEAGDGTPMSIAIDYLRHLEREVDWFGGSPARYSGIEVMSDPNGHPVLYCDACQWYGNKSSTSASADLGHLVDIALVHKRTREHRENLNG